AGRHWPRRVSGARASMEPSRERDGGLASSTARSRRRTLQWSRRANATEASASSGIARLEPRFNGAVARTRRRPAAPHRARRKARAASMEPSRERDGGSAAGWVMERWEPMLQWSRRANATEAADPEYVERE